MLRIRLSMRAASASMAKTYAEETADLARVGHRQVRRDAVGVAAPCDPAIRADVEGAGQGPEALADLNIDAVTAAVVGAPAGMLLGHPHGPR
jgi:hypothetical protein